MMPLQYLPAAAALLLLLPPGHGSGGGGNLTVEPWYVGLQHFGPLSGEGWGQRKMTLVDNYTFRIENLTAEAGTEYMFVAPQGCTALLLLLLLLSLLLLLLLLLLLFSNYY